MEPYGQKFVVSRPVGPGAKGRGSAKPWCGAVPRLWTSNLAGVAAGSRPVSRQAGDVRFDAMPNVLVGLAQLSSQALRNAPSLHGRVSQTDLSCGR